MGVRTLVSKVPISAMNASGHYIALGTVDGSILIWNAATWKLVKQFDHIHELPVTCLAIRPEFETTDPDVTVHVRSASADSKLAHLSLQRKVPKRRTPANVSSSDTGLLTFLHRMIVAIVVVWILSPMCQDAYDACGQQWHHASNLDQKLVRVSQCIFEDVLWAPGHKPGISQPPY